MTTSPALRPVDKKRPHAEGGPDGCERCGKPHPRCAAHNRQGGPCGMQPPKLHRVCTFHGAGSPAARETARRKDAELKAAAVVTRWTEGRDIAVDDPVTELSNLAGEVIAFKDYLRDQVAKLDGTLTYWQEQGFEDDDGHGFTKAAEDMRAVVGAYERALDRSARILASIVKLDLSARMLEVNTAKARVIVGAVREGLAQVDMEHAIRRAAEAAIAQALANVREAEPREIPS